MTLASANQFSPALTVSGIDTPDASAHDFTLELPAGAVVEVNRGRRFWWHSGDGADPLPQLFAFLPDGSGKALGLTRTIMTPLPSATDCLGGRRMADP